MRQIGTNSILTHWGRDKMASIFQTIFSIAFSWMKMFKFRLIFHWSVFPRVQLTIFQHWPGDKPLSKPMMVSLLTHICVTRAQWLNKTNVDMRGKANSSDNNFENWIMIIYVYFSHQWNMRPHNMSICKMYLKKCGESFVANSYHYHWISYIDPNKLTDS